MLLSSCFSGTLKECSLLIYGTAGRPYPRHGERGARSAEMLMDSDLIEEYSGESRTGGASSSSSDVSDGS